MHERRNNTTAQHKAPNTAHKMYTRKIGEKSQLANRLHERALSKFRFGMYVYSFSLKCGGSMSRHETV